MQDIRAIYPRSSERSSKFQSESGNAASPRDLFSRQFIGNLTGHCDVFKHRYVPRYCRCTSPRGALVLCKLSDEILNSGQKESDRLCCSPSPSLWLRSRAQQRLRAHLYSWRSTACTSSNVLSLLRRKTDTPWAEEGGTSSLSLSFSCLLWMLTHDLSVCACVARAGAYVTCNTEN